MTEGAKPPASQPAGDGYPSVDPAQLAELRALSPAGDAWLIRELLQPFLRGSTQGLAELRAACLQADAAQIERLAHNLKGAGGTIGVRALADVARRIMEQARAGNLQAVPPLLDAYAAEQARVKEILMREFPGLTSPA